MYRFADFVLDPASRQLTSGGRVLALGERALDLLLALVESAGRLLTKDELLDLVWRDVIVEEANLHVQMTSIRKVVGREAIRTVPGRGYQFVLAVSPARPAGAPSNVSAAPTPPAAMAASGLPALHGREAELAAVERLLGESILVTVTGAGGSGKTLLARHLAHRLAGWRPGGTAWVDLLDVTEPVALPAAVAGALGVGAGSAGALANALRGVDLLLVLDNAEHLLDSVADLVREVGHSAPEVRLLVTSQASLGLAGERVLPLRGLPVPPRGVPVQQALGYASVAVFVERARAIDRRFRLAADNVDDVVALCAALGGSALGIQLAAALLAMQPLHEVRRRLVRDTVDAGASAIDPAANVLAAALAWSHGLLDEPAQRVFRRLAVAVGSLPLEVALALAGDADLDATAAADALADLVDRSLVDLEAGDGATQPRYRLLDAPRAVALQSLRASGEAPSVQARLARVLADGGTQRDEPLALAQADVLTALDWAFEHDAGAAVVIARRWLGWQMPVAQRTRIVDRLLALVPALSPRAAAEALLTTAPLLGAAALRRRADLLLQAVALAAGAGEALLEHEALAKAAESFALLREPDAAEPLLQRALRLQQPDWPDAQRHAATYAAALLAGSRNRLEEAVQAWEAVLASNIGAATRSVPILTTMADMELSLGRARAAEAHLREAEAVCRRDRRMADLYSYVLTNLCAARIALGDFEGARAAAQEGWPQAQRFGAAAWWADHLALLAACEGRVHTAAGLLGYSDATYAALNDTRQALEQRHAEAAAERARRHLGAERFEALRRRAARPDFAAQVQAQALSRQDGLPPA